MKETGLDPGLRQVSNIRLARTRDRMDEYHYYAGVAETIGVWLELLTRNQVKEIWPLCDVEGIVGAIQHPRGRLHPACGPDAGPGARPLAIAGPRSIAKRRSLRSTRLPGGEWKISTDKGDITCEHIAFGDRQFRQGDRPHGRN